MSRKHFQVVVVGSGFAGSLTAMIAKRLGYSTALIERGRHPRFAIGESSTPLANLLLEEIATEYDLPFVRPLCKWGTWQKQLPQLPCGLKRGFTFYHHKFDRPFGPDPERRRQLLVGASPRDEIADTHWYRPHFDHYLVQQARTLGVDFWDETILNNATKAANGMLLDGTRHGKAVEFSAEFVVDATGPRGFLFSALGLPEKKFTALPATQALFSHFRNVGPLPDSFSSSGRTPPYPPEQAAVHHVFPGGWVWVLKFNNGITSAGVAATDAVARRMDFSSGQPAWRRLLERLPSLAEIFQPARAVIPFVHSPRLAFRSGVVAGPNWALLPSAAGFVDPLLSTGFPLTLLGVARIARLLGSHWQKSSFQAQIDDYGRLTLLELDSAARLVGALYATMDRFDLFKELTLLYFAAASFSETARRLGKPQLADSFLLCRHAVFAKQLRQICAASTKPLSPRKAAKVLREIREAIEPLDVAGLTDDSRHPWYPALAADLLRAAPKFGVSKAKVTLMLRRCGFPED
jgi:FADH2 O2-dependent halogenase